MIKIEKTETYGWEAVIRGMRNPMNSWDKSDSEPCLTHGPEHCNDCLYLEGSCSAIESDLDSRFIIGPNDHALMMHLVSAGTDHSKFMRMIIITADVTAPLYWWKEYDTYKVGTVANSCSTMHKIGAKTFTLEDFSCEHMERRSKAKLENLIDELNFWRALYLDGGYESYDGRRYEPKDKVCWWQMIQLLPSSYNQRRTIQLNYAVLRNIYHARKKHKLDEWRDFCKWIESLPYSEMITK